MAEDKSLTLLIQSINNNFKRLNGNEILSSEEFSSFSNELDLLKQKNSTEHQKVVKEIISNIEKIYGGHQQEINQAIEAASTNNLPNTQTSELNEKYINLLNVYHLGKAVNSIDLPADKIDICHYHLPFAINALTLAGKLPTTGQHGQIQFGKALYPPFFTQDHLLSEKKGVKKSDKYFLIKKINKVYKGDTGDNTFLASDGKKIFYIRGVREYSPNAVLASKIATLVSKQHFSSERLLDNQFAASRKLDQYAVCAVRDNDFRSKRGNFLKNNVSPGTGIIDETLNYLQEGDPNAENYGFSSEDLNSAHLVKIDFDKCNLTSPVDFEHYDVGMVTKFSFPNAGANLYKASPHVQKDPNYLYEKLTTRLKLSLLPQKLIAELAEKAYRDGIDDDAKKLAVAELTHRSNIALNLLCCDENAVEVFKKHPKQLAIAVDEIAVYVNRHFHPDIAATILATLKKRAETVQQKIKTSLKVDFVAPTLVVPASAMIKDTRILRVAVDIDEYEFPGEERSDFDVSQEGELLFGDLHANGLKLFWLLNYHNLLTTTKSDYEKIRNIYRNKDLLNKNISVDQRKKIIAEFDQVIDNANINDIKALLVFIGDELGDRGLNDYFILKIFEKLHKSGVQFDVLLSNHGLNFLRAFMEGRLDQQTMGGEPPNAQDQSKLNLAQLIKDGVISHERIEQLVKECYLPHLVPAAFAIDDHNTLFSAHAPVGKDAINAMAKRLNIQTERFPTEWNEGEQLAAKVEIARALFQVYVQNGLLFDELINAEYEAILGGRYPDKIHQVTKDLSEYIFEYLAWSRQTKFTLEQRPEKLKCGRNYATAHGHDSKKSPCGLVYNLDNLLGKGESLHRQNDEYNKFGDSHYTTLYSPQKSLVNYFNPKNNEALQSIIKEHVEALEKMLAVKIAEKSAIAELRALLDQAEQKRKQWDKATKILADSFSELENSSLKEKPNALKTLKHQFENIKKVSAEIDVYANNLTQSLTKIPNNTKTQSIRAATEEYIAVFAIKTIWITDKSSSLTGSARRLSFEQIEERIKVKEEDLIQAEKEAEELANDFEKEAKQVPNLSSDAETITYQPPKNLLFRSASYMGSFLWNSSSSTATQSKEKIPANTTGTMGSEKLDRTSDKPVSIPASSLNSSSKESEEKRQQHITEIKKRREQRAVKSSAETEQLRIENTKLSTNLNQMSETNNSLASENEFIKKELTTKRDEFEKITEELRLIREKHEQEVKEHNLAKEKFAKTEQIISNLNQELENAHKENKSLQEVAIKSQKDNEILIQKNQETATKAKTVEDELVKEKDAHQKTTELLHNSTTELEKTKQENIRIKNLYDTVLATQQKTNFELTQKIRAKQTVDQTNKQLLEQNQKLQQDLTTETQAKERLSRDNQRLTQEVADLKKPQVEDKHEKKKHKNDDLELLVKIDDKKSPKNKRKKPQINPELTNPNNTAITAENIKAARLNGNEILAALGQIYRSKPDNQAELWKGTWIKKQKARAVLIVENSVGQLNMSEILKLYALVESKHNEDHTNSYRFIRREQDLFRCNYGNTSSWQKIMEAIKARLTTLATEGEFDKLDNSADRYIIPVDNKKSDKTKFCEMMKTHTVHDYGFGFFRPAVITACLKEKIETYEQQQLSIRAK